MLNKPRQEAGLRTLSTIKIAKWQESYRQGNIGQCVQMARNWVDVYPGDHTSWQLLGVSLLYAGALIEAVPALQQACRIKSDSWSLWDNLAIALQHSGRHAEAAKAFRRALRLAPGRASVWSNASTNQLQMGVPQEAMRLAKRAADLAPNLAEAHLGLGNALSQLGQSDEAMASFENALRFKPGFPQAMLSLGMEYSHRGELTQACTVTEQVLAAYPTFAAAHVNMGGFRSKLGDIVTAGEHFRAARSIAPARIDAWSGVLYCSLHDDRLSPEQVFAEHNAFKQHIDASASYPSAPRPHENIPDPHKRLRLGFVSGDLRKHPVAMFMEPVWRYLDRDKVEIFAYDNHPVDDDIAKQLKALADHWETVSGMSDVVLAERIRKDRIDILFDLSGHTGHNRLGAFAHKPAPLQVTWLGYPGTTGLSAMDYNLVNSISAPLEETGWQFTEELAYLPQTALLDRPDGLPALAEPPICAKGHITFGSFHRLNKLNDDVIATWGKILERIPSARLLIGAVPSREAEEVLLVRLRRHGVDEKRLTIRHRTGMTDFLALHNEVDVLLDTWPFSSGTTANLALWMGVPTLTLTGPIMMQRLCAARLVPLGLEMFIAETKDQYVDLAEAWSHKADELARLKTHLRHTLSVNNESNTVTVTRAFEDRLRDMWQRWCDDLPPTTLQ